jgi:hypothetical protein
MESPIHETWQTRPSLRVTAPRCSCAGWSGTPPLQPGAGEIAHACADHVASYVCGIRRICHSADARVWISVDWIAFSIARVLNEDSRRVRDLYDLTVQIENKRYDGGLQGPPANLTDVGLTARDPFTDPPYEYRKLDGERYQVCAEFRAASLTASGPALFWAHPAGRKCFDIGFGRSAPYPPNYFQ